MAAPTYRERLRIEGAMLAGTGAVGSGLLLALTPQARRWPLSTIGQLALVAVLLARFAPRGARKAMARSEELLPGTVGSGEPTPLWHIPPLVAVLTLSVVLPPVSRLGWDAGLRVTGGCTLVGLAQMILIERTVAADERRQGKTYFRMFGSRLGRGTRLGFTSD